MLSHVYFKSATGAVTQFLTLVPTELEVPSPFVYGYEKHSAVDGERNKKCVWLRLSIYTKLYIIHSHAAFLCTSQHLSIL